MSDSGKRQFTIALKALIGSWQGLTVVLIVGIAARAYVSTLGQNFDVESYRIVVSIIDQGENVYAQTNRYNYAPLWCNLIYGIYHLGIFLFGKNGPSSFHSLVMVFLTIIDISIFVVLLKQFSLVAAAFFFLNPLSVMVTGYCCQFDNFALLLGMLSVLILRNDGETASWRKRLASLAVLSLSLITKHLLFAFPLWLAVKQKKYSVKLVFLLVPIVLFFVSFIPYWNAGREGIINNVFLYNSFPNRCFYRLFVPWILQMVFSAKAVWFIALTISALYFRNKKPMESLLLYSGILVATTPSMANQYLAIVVPFISVFPNIFFFLYTIAGGWYLMISLGNDLHIEYLQRLSFFDGVVYYYALLVTFLCLGIVFQVWRRPCLMLYNRMCRKIESLIGFLRKRIVSEVK